MEWNGSLAAGQVRRTASGERWLSVGAIRPLRQGQRKRSLTLTPLTRSLELFHRRWHYPHVLDIRHLFYRITYRIVRVIVVIVLNSHHFLHLAHLFLQFDDMI